MGTEMTLAEILAEARRLDEAATKGPWEDCEDEDGIPVVCIPPEHEGPIAWNIRGGPGGRADCLILTPAGAASRGPSYEALRLLPRRPRRRPPLRPRGGADVRHPARLEEEEVTPGRMIRKCGPGSIRVLTRPCLET